jgi:hypothetical protein
MLADVEAAIRRSPLLCDVLVEKDVADLRQPIEKKGKTNLNTVGPESAECG